MGQDSTIRILNRKKYRGHGRPKNTDYKYTTWGVLLTKHAREMHKCFTDIARAERRLLPEG